MHLIAMESRCAAVHRDHRGSGFPKPQSVHPNSPVVSHALLLLKNGMEPSSNENKFLKQANVKKDFARRATLCTLDGEQG